MCGGWEEEKCTDLESGVVVRCTVCKTGYELVRLVGRKIEVCIEGRWEGCSGMFTKMGILQRSTAMGMA